MGKWIGAGMILLGCAGLLYQWYKTQKEMFKTQTIAAAAKSGVVYGGPQYARRDYRDDYG